MTMPYGAQWAKVDNGVTALFVPGVVFAGMVTRAERPDWGLTADLDAAWWDKAVDTARMREGKGKKAAYLLLRHNGFLQPEAGHKGFLSNIRFEIPDAVADIYVTDPEEIAAVIRGERANISMEVDEGRFYVWGLSMIEGAEGHFSEEIPEFTVSGVSLKDPEYVAIMAGTGAQPVAGDLAECKRLVTCAQSRNKRKQKMDSEASAGGSGEVLPKLDGLEKLEGALSKLGELEKLEKAMGEAMERLELTFAKTAIMGEISSRGTVVPKEIVAKISAAKSVAEIDEISANLAKMPVAKPREDYAKPESAGVGTASARAEAALRKIMSERRIQRFDAVRALRKENGELFDEWLSEANGGKPVVNGRVQ